MPVLKNIRHERFAQEVIKGKPVTEAYTIAGYKPHPANCFRLREKENVSARITELQTKISNRTEITVASVIAELAKLGYSNMADYTTIGSDGLPFVDMSKVSRDQMAAIQEVIVETRIENEKDADGKTEAIPVRKVRFKLADKRAALVDIGKHLGAFKEIIEHTGNVTLSEGKTSAEMLLEMLAEMKALGVTPEMLALPMPKMIDVSEGVANLEGGEGRKINCVKW